jgi:excisionase family DNA binding protein
MSTSVPAPLERQALTIGEAAKRLGVHRETLRSAIERGEIPAARLGRRWLVLPAPLDDLLSQRSES